MSDFGWRICQMTVDNSGLRIVDYGSQLSFNMVKPIGSDKWRMYASSYSNYLTVTFQVGKISCDVGPEEVTVEEYREMMRWLNRKRFGKFTVVQPGYERIYYEGSFNVQPIQFGGRGFWNGAHLYHQQALRAWDNAEPFLFNRRRKGDLLHL